MLRITSGKCKGLTLFSPDSSGTRPTSDRVRQAVFNTLRSMRPLDGVRVADLFAGTGALGIEAASNGATQVVFVEGARPAQSTLQRNLDRYLVSADPRDAQLHLVPGRVEQVYSRLPRVDLVFCDPPYVRDGEGFQLVDLCNLERVHCRVAPGGLIVFEGLASAASGVNFDFGSGFELLKTKQYGDTVVWFLLRRAHEGVA